MSKTLQVHCTKLHKTKKTEAPTVTSSHGQTTLTLFVPNSSMPSCIIAKNSTWMLCACQQ